MLQTNSWSLHIDNHCAFDVARLTKNIKEIRTEILFEVGRGGKLKSAIGACVGRLTNTNFEKRSKLKIRKRGNLSVSTCKKNFASFFCFLTYIKTLCRN